MANNFQQNYTHSAANGSESHFGGFEADRNTCNTKKATPPALHE